MAKKSKPARRYVNTYWSTLSQKHFIYDLTPKELFGCRMCKQANASTMRDSCIYELVPVEGE